MSFTHELAATPGAVAGRNDAIGQMLSVIGTNVARYGLVLILLMIGGLKYTPIEAAAIQPLVAHSPLLSWLYGLFSIESASKIIGTLEITAALLIAARPLSASASALGSLMAVGTFLTTVSFLFSTPGVWEAGYGFPALSATGAFLIKDLVLLGAAVLTLGEALHAASARSAA
jgi:uncharacterized membrane protein YkgB